VLADRRARAAEMCHGERRAGDGGGGSRGRTGTRSPSAGQSLHDHVFLVNEFMTAGKQPAEGRALAN
jgi:hypothetical protein